MADREEASQPRKINDLPRLTGADGLVDRKRYSDLMANRFDGPSGTKNPASVAARGGARNGLDSRPKPRADYALGGQLATDRLRELARDIRRVPDPIRSNPARILELREEIAAEVRDLARRIDQSGCTARAVA